jgi:signal transduction histidine kinase
MDRPVRIAVVGPVDERLVGDVRQLPLHPEVRAFVSVVSDSEALLRLQPDVVLIGFGADPGEEIGALRFWRQSLPSLGVVVVTSAAQEVATAPLAHKLRALLLVYPDTPGQLAAILEQARLGSDRPRADTFVDLARGIADEINNPLMFVSGYLQLLRSGLQGAERDRRDQVAAAMSGVARIEAAIERLRLLSAAANGPRTRGDVDLAAVLQQQLATRARGEGTARLAIGEGSHVVRGDAEHLAAAIGTIALFADSLAAAGAATELRLEASGDARRLCVVANGSAIAHWQLPLTFEPYYPSRALRGQGSGLGLFLAQTVVLAHRGQATVRRLPDGALQFDFVLPS